MDFLGKHRVHYSYRTALDLVDLECRNSYGYCNRKHQLCHLECSLSCSDYLQFEQNSLRKCVEKGRENVTISRLNRSCSSFHKSVYFLHRIRPDNLSVEQLVRDFRLLLHVNGLTESKTSEYEAMHKLMLLNNLEIPQLMGEFAPPCSSMFERCMWKGTQWRCDNLFQMVNSTEGLCCSFNYYGTRFNNYLK